MSFSILQWNMNGYFNNYHELILLPKELNPDIICLQETHIKSYTQISAPKPFIGYFYNLSANLYAKQGVGILIRNNIPHKTVYLNSSTCSIGIEILSQPNTTIFHSYICTSKSEHIR